MSTDKLNIPTLSSNTSYEVRRAIDSIRLWADRLQVGGTTIIQQSSSSGGGEIVDSPFEDLTTPPALTGFTATGNFFTILLKWDMAAYDYFSYVEVWRSGTEDFGDAVLIGASPGNIYLDTPPATNASQTFWYWVRSISLANVAGPYSTSASASTADNPEYYLSVLSGQITESELAATLNSRLDDTDEAIQVEQIVRAVSLAPDYDPLSTYSIGKTVHYGGKIYRCTTAISSPEPWTLLHWTEVPEGGLYTQYTVRLDVNGYVSGFGMANDGNTSSFLVHADTFAVGKPGQTGIYPFVIGTVDGVTAVCIAKGLIQDASIYSAQIYSLGADKITAGTIDANIVTISNLVVGTNVTMGPNAYISWNNVSSRPTSLSGINSTEGSKLTGIATGATKNTIYRTGGSVPSAANAGDLWYVTSTTSGYATNVLYRANGSTWEVAGSYGAPGDAPVGTITGNTVSGWSRAGYTTYIDGRTIYTGDAYVDTLQVAGFAITVPVTAGNSGSFSANNRLLSSPAYTITNTMVGGSRLTCVCSGWLSFSVDLGNNFVYVVPNLVTPYGSRSGAGTFTFNSSKKCYDSGLTYQYLVPFTFTTYWSPALGDVGSCRLYVYAYFYDSANNPVSLTGQYQCVTTLLGTKR